jgi:tetratricopeptide (TPR) repeat protein
MLKFICSSFVGILITVAVAAQDKAVWLKEAENLLRQLNETAALDKYKQVLAVDAVNTVALVKAAELTANVGARLTDKKQSKEKKIWFETAYAYAQRAYKTDTASADANYVMAMASGKMTEVEDENKKVVAFVRDIKLYADKALAINPNHAKANFTLGKWHMEMTNLSFVKKMAVKAFYGGLPEGKMDEAIKYMEKCRSLDPYFMLNYLELAKAYEQENRPTQAIEVLQKMVKLPLRTADDASLKAEGKKKLDGLL